MNRELCNICDQEALIVYRHGEARCGDHAIPNARLLEAERDAEAEGWSRADEIGLRSP